ncbi:hypothetical protein PG996_002088 [Apiospora saccharicola]|uniref:Uncharacterized protein n=1 Tax=Apiospora saccharicola TaxID=335842 RepID=A0ABR1WIK9_9PEZI
MLFGSDLYSKREYRSLKIWKSISRFDNLTEPDMPVNVVFGGVPILGYFYQSNPVLPNFLINAPWVQPAD